MSFTEMNDNNNNLKEMLTRYYNAETSEQEEAMLRRMVADSDTSDDTLSANERDFLSQIFPPEGFEQRMSDFIDRLAADEKHKTRIVSMRRKRWIAGITATVAIMISVLTYVGHSDDDKFNTDTYATPEEAYHDTKYALGRFSSTLNRGFSELKKINK